MAIINYQYYLLLVINLHMYYERNKCNINKWNPCLPLLKVSLSDKNWVLWDRPARLLACSNPLVPKYTTISSRRRSSSLANICRKLRKLCRRPASGSITWIMGGLWLGGAPLLSKLEDSSDSCTVCRGANGRMTRALRTGLAWCLTLWKYSSYWVPVVGSLRYMPSIKSSRVYLITSEV